MIPAIHLAGCKKYSCNKKINNQHACYVHYKQVKTGPLVVNTYAADA